MSSIQSTSEGVTTFFSDSDITDETESSLETIKLSNEKLAFLTVVKASVVKIKSTSEPLNPQKDISKRETKFYSFQATRNLHLKLRKLAKLLITQTQSISSLKICAQDPSPLENPKDAIESITNTTVEIIRCTIELQEMRNGAGNSGSNVKDCKKISTVIEDVTLLTGDCCVFILKEFDIKMLQLAAALSSANPSSKINSCSQMKSVIESANKLIKSVCESLDLIYSILIKESCEDVKNAIGIQKKNQVEYNLYSISTKKGILEEICVLVKDGDLKKIDCFKSDDKEIHISISGIETRIYYDLEQISEKLIEFFISETNSRYLQLEDLRKYSLKFIEDSQNALTKKIFLDSVENFIGMAFTDSLNNGIRSSLAETHEGLNNSTNGENHCTIPEHISSQGKEEDIGIVILESKDLKKQDKSQNNNCTTLDLVNELQKIKSSIIYILTDEVQNLPRDIIFADLVDKIHTIGTKIVSQSSALLIHSKKQQLQSKTNWTSSFNVRDKSLDHNINSNHKSLLDMEMSKSFNGTSMLRSNNDFENSSRSFDPKRGESNLIRTLEKKIDENIVQREDNKFKAECTEFVEVVRELVEVTKTACWIKPPSEEIVSTSINEIQVASIPNFKRNTIGYKTDDPLLEKSVVKVGWLYKCSRRKSRFNIHMKSVSGWTERWFRLLGNQIEYYSYTNLNNKSRNKLKGVIPLVKQSTIVVSKEIFRGKLNVLELRSPNTKKVCYYFYHEDEDELNLWLSAISAVITNTQANAGGNGEEDITFANKKELRKSSSRSSILSSLSKSSSVNDKFRQSQTRMSVLKRSLTQSHQNVSVPRMNARQVGIANSTSPTQPCTISPRQQQQPVKTVLKAVPNVMATVAKLEELVHAIMLFVNEMIEYESKKTISRGYSSHIVLDTTIISLCVHRFMRTLS